MAGRPLGSQNQTTPRDLAFVANYCKGMSAREAALKAGFKVSIANAHVPWILKKPNIKAAIREFREKIVAETAYDVKSAMTELEAVIEHAKATDNSTAYARAVELRMRLHGLLVDKSQVQSVGGFSINIKGIESQEPPAQLIDLTSTPVPPTRGLRDIFGDE